MTNIEDQIKRIKEKLPRVKEKDSQLEVFGACSHEYALNPPASMDEIRQFESQYKVELPLEYKAFLTAVGNGGVGPYYGIFQLNEMESSEDLSQTCKLRPDLADGEWADMISFHDVENMADEEYELAFNNLFQGMLFLGSQGCSYYMMLVVSGDYRGRVVYIDTELGKPFFTYEDHFLDWYERWLDEILLDYDLHWYGTKMGGDDAGLIRKFQQSTDKTYQIAAIEGMYKLPNLLPETILFLENLCVNNEENFSKTAMGLLAKHDFKKAKPHLLELLKSEDEESRLLALQKIHWYVQEADQEIIAAIQTILPVTNNPESFRFITYILEKYKQSNIPSYIPFFYHSDKAIRIQALYASGKLENREKYLKDFIHCLDDEEPDVVRTAVQSLHGLKDPSLIPHFQRLLDKHPTNEHYIRSNVEIRLKQFNVLDHLKSKLIKGD